MLLECGRVQSVQLRCKKPCSPSCSYRNISLQSFKPRKPRSTYNSKTLYKSYNIIWSFQPNFMWHQRASLLDPFRHWAGARSWRSAPRPAQYCWCSHQVPAAADPQLVGLTLSQKYLDPIFGSVYGFQLDQQVFQNSISYKPIPAGIKKYGTEYLVSMRIHMRQVRYTTPEKRLLLHLLFWKRCILGSGWAQTSCKCIFVFKISLGFFQRQEHLDWHYEVIQAT